MCQTLYRSLITFENPILYSILAIFYIGTLKIKVVKLIPHV